MLFSSYISDILDTLGYRDQVALLSHSNNGRSFSGRVRTVQLETVETNNENIGLGLGFIERLRTDDVLVVAGSDSWAYFGELMTRLSERQGYQGCIIDGKTRDSPFTYTSAFPVYSQGYTPVDIKGRGRVVAVDVPVTFGGVTVQPGDRVVVDTDAAVLFSPKCGHGLTS